MDLENWLVINKINLLLIEACLENPDMLTDSVNCARVFTFKCNTM